jgi:gluconokinase
MTGLSVERLDDTRTPPRAGIILMGVSGSGKSTVGNCLAAAIGCSFLEGDDFHSPASIAKMRSGEPLDDADRWPWLDRLGAAMGLAVTRDGVAVAACSSLKRCYRLRLAKAAAVPLRFVLLDVPRADLERRLRARAAHYMPASLLDSQVAALERPDADECALTLDATAPCETLVDAILRWAGRSPSDLHAPN